MSSPTRKQDSPLDVEAASVLLRMSAKGKTPKRAGSQTPEPPRVPPPTRVATPSPPSTPGLKWLAPLTPMDFAALSLADSDASSSPETSPREADDVRYFFLPPVTPLDFQDGTSDLWRALVADPAADSDPAVETAPGPPGARGKRGPRRSIRQALHGESDDGDDGQLADGEGSEKSATKEVAGECVES